MKTSFLFFVAVFRVFNVSYIEEQEKFDQGTSLPQKKIYRSLLSSLCLCICEQLSVLADPVVSMILEENHNLHRTLVTDHAQHSVVKQLNGLALFLNRHIGRNTDKKVDLIHRTRPSILLGDPAQIKAESVGIELAQILYECIMQLLLLLLGHLT